MPQRGGEGAGRPPAIVTNLEKRLSGGDKALIGNTGYRRYLRRTGVGKASEIDAGKLAEEARFDAIFVLRTNAGMTPLNAVLSYRELLLVEDLFRRAKVQLRTRPIIPLLRRGDPGPCFQLLLGAGAAEGAGRPLPIPRAQRRMGRSVIRDLDHLQEATIEKDGKRVTTRTYVEGQVGRVFQAAGVALPPNGANTPPDPSRPRIVVETPGSAGVTFCFYAYFRIALLKLGLTARRSRLPSGAL